MTTKQMLEDHLKNKGALQPSIHPVVRTAINTITGEVPYRLKVSIALSELITLTSHLRKSIKLYDGTLVPTNAITFSLARSGVAKDSSMNMVRKSMKVAYDMIEQYRKDLARHNAEQAAVLDGKTKEDWLSYYRKPRDLQPGLGTVEGLVNHFADLESGEVGAASINSSEIGSELMSNGNMLDIVKTISIGYDLGKIPAKIVKSVDNQVSGINNLPINALFFGSEDAILHDNGIKSKFKTMFSTQLARRSIFSFTPEKPEPLQIDSVEELAIYRNRERERAVIAQNEMQDICKLIIENSTSNHIEMSAEAQTLFDIYKEYNSLESEDMLMQYPISKLARKHKQWLALKLSGTYAIVDGNEEVTEKNYIDAINTIESFSTDLMAFEKELIKEPYEIFCEFCKTNAEKGKLTVDLHKLRKLGYIPTSGAPKGRLEELVHLASAYDKEAIYTVCCNNSICYEEIVKTDIAGLSYKEVSGNKAQRAKQCSTDFMFAETEFEELGAMLTCDFAYSPFQFLDGKRSKDSIVGGCKFLVLDIDKSEITDMECHNLLADVNHHIARTSDPNNQFKFRVLVELDSIVNVDDKVWKYFLQEVTKSLGLEVDILPKSQIFFSYQDRDVLSVLDAQPLETRNLIIAATEKAMSREPAKKLTNAQQKTLLEDPLETFSYAFNAESGEGSRSLVRAGLHAIDLGATQEQVEKLIYEINDYWVYPMDKSRIESTVLSYLNRKF